MSILTVSITESQIFQALGDFISSVLSPFVDVSRGQQNRKAEPSNDDYVVMWPLLRTRLSTNIDSLVDVAFQGSISGSGANAVLTVAQMLAGAMEIGLTLSGLGVPAGVTIGQQLTGTTTSPAGIGTYQLVGVSGTLSIAHEIMQAGYEQFMKPTQVDIQVDVHGPNSADNAEIIATLFRSSYGVDAFSAEGAAIGITFAAGVSMIGAVDVTPLYCEDPRQSPFLNAEQQYEERWTVDVHLQANLAIRVPRQFAGSLSLVVNNVS